LRGVPAAPRALAAALLLVILAPLAGCGGGATATVAAQGSGPRLRWAPPHLDDPVTIRLGDGYTTSRLPPDQDAVIELPDTVKRGGVTIEGGHDVVIVGGQIAIPQGTPMGIENNRFRTGVYIKGATGTVHVEGVRLAAGRGVEWDAVDVAAPRATVQLENIRADRLHGSLDGFHADVVQPWGGVRNLRIDRLTASSDYQGVTIPVDAGPIGRAELGNVDVSGLGDGSGGGGHLLWLTSGTEGCDSYPVQLRRFYVEPRPQAKFSKSVWPQVKHPPGCAALVRRGTISWPQLPSVRGAVLHGAPSRSFVPAGVAGLDYASPGYRR
jgi:hypothetical protein